MVESNAERREPVTGDGRREVVPRPKLSVVIPAHNESSRIVRTLGRIRDYLVSRGWSGEIVVVDDGSSDDTVELVRGFDAGPLAVRIERLAGHQGKGFAVRAGMLSGAGELLLLCDADLSTPIDQVEKLLAAVRGGADVAIGSRDLPASRLEPPQPWARRLPAWVFRALRRRLLLPQLRDTQCGFKLFRREVARAVFARQTVAGWLFDCEILALAEAGGFRIEEVGVVWRDDPRSRVRVAREILPSLVALWSIRRRVRGLRQA
jgi:glycosyltransferase involved in cell wall biosynthesis